MYGGTALAAPILFHRVHAAGQEAGGQKQTKCRPSQLPIYDEPQFPELEVVPEAESAFREYVSGARKWAWHYLESVQTTTDKLRETWEVGKAHTQGALAYIREDSAVLPRATIITVAGLGGIVAGYRGGILRKVFYASVGMTVAASLCYPHEAEDIAKKGLHTVRDFAYKTYDDTFGGSDVKTSEPKKAKVEEPKQEEKPKPSTGDGSSAKKDFGMSKPEDKDMYTKRAD